MKQSESIAKLADALVKAQGEMRGVAKDATNPDYRSRYASLDAIVGQVRPVLAKHGLAIVQGATTPHSDEAGRLAAICVETMVIHSSGEWLTNTAIMPVVGRMLKGGGRADPDPQAGGSALTYGRRYGLAALLCLATDEDDDGNSAAQRSGGAKRNGATGEARSQSQAASASATPPAVPASAPKGAASKKMPFGKHKGVELGELPSEILRETVKWCTEKDAGKFEDLIDACDEVLALRQDQAA